MIPRLLLALLVLFGTLLPASALAQEAGEDAEETDASDEDSDDASGEEQVGPEPLEDPLSRYRTPFGVLAERTIGTASRPVEFNWRRSRVHLGATGSHVFELNTFNSLRAGGMVRWPGRNLLYEVDVNYVWAWDSIASRKLALTPYRQPGRPSRLELDFNVGIPLAEGIVTTRPRWFPAAEMVFSAYGGMRYLFYTQGYRGMRVGQIAGAVLSPVLTDAEVDNLEYARLDAMQVDRGRYTTMVGLGNDIYFKQGVFISPRVMVAIPIFAGADGTSLYFWGDFTLVVGVAL